ncbi:hypothetical protein SFRURICE_018474 [Spodoptera frugiperda]|nr:hypothetical protein SFRURICE_018474 [Spodoptera frugiperda]
MFALAENGWSCCQLSSIILVFGCYYNVVANSIQLQSGNSKLNHNDEITHRYLFLEFYIRRKEGPSSYHYVPNGHRSIQIIIIRYMYRKCIKSQVAFSFGKSFL